MRPSAKPRRLLLVTLALFYLTSCNSNEYVARDYLNRLNNVLDTDILPETPVDLTFPTVKQQQTEQVPSSISIRDFLSLRGCELHNILAQRNSQLGRVASASQNLIIDIKIIVVAPDCFPLIQTPSLHDKLQRYLSHKKEVLPNTLWHAILAQNEYRSFWRANSNYIEQNTVTGITALDQSLTFLTNFSQQQLLKPVYFNESQFEQSLGILSHGGGGNLVKELLNIESHLAAANEAIQQRLKHKLCLNNRPTPSAKNFKNVVNNYFLQVQNRTVLLHRRSNQLMPLINQLEDLLAPFSNTEFQAWREHRNKRIEAALMAITNHSKMIQKLYKQCGLKVGNR